MVTEKQRLTDEHLQYAGIRFVSGFFCVSYPNLLSKNKKNINSALRPFEQYSVLREYSGFKIPDFIDLAFREYSGFNSPGFAGEIKGGD